ncbi:Flavodoxin [anaerobic digester metagenome]
MSTLVVFFSFEGNTKLVGDAIAKTMGADTVELKTSKQYPTAGIGKFFWGGKSVLFGETPQLVNERIDLSKYDTVIIGTPIWAGSFAPPIKSFITEYQMKGKRIGLFACHGGGGAKKCFSKLREAYPENQFIGEIAFLEPKKNPQVSVNEAAKWASEL